MAWTLPQRYLVWAFAVAATLVAPALATAAMLDEPLAPLPLTLKIDPARAALGNRLFHDPRLSVNGSVSCASCHETSRAGADGRVRSPGAHGGTDGFNTPTVYNAAFNFKQFWTGRAESLEAQIDSVVQNPTEMDSKWPRVIVMAELDDAYRQAFAESYRDGVTRANIENAIASYERTLITPNARFDRYLRGDANAITAEEKSGYAKFKQYGCVACHQGQNVGGNMFQKFGIMEDYFAARGHRTRADLGRYLITHNEDDKYVFKVPSLRNVAQTAPYFHDGSAPTLDAAVDVMFRYQLGRVASRDDKRSIIAFLKTLSGTPK